MSGDIAESVALILHSYDKKIEIHGADVKSNRINTNLCTKIFLPPLTSDSNYRKWLFDVLDKEKYDFFIPCSESEINYLASLPDKDMKAIEDKTELVWAGKKVVEKLSSKCLTYKFLNSMGLDTPEMYSLEIARTHLPVVVKPDVGRGSHNVFICRNQEELNAAIKIVHRPIIQEFLEDDESEFTCAVYRDHTLGVKNIIIRRYLSNGSTSWGEIAKHSGIEDICTRIATKLDLQGSINIQLRIKNHRLVIFEINPRFSSTVYLRSLVHFNDLLWSIGLSSPNEYTYAESTTGTKFKVMKVAFKLK